MSADAQSLLGGLSADETTRVIIESMGRSALPYLRDPQVRTRAIGIAKTQGLFERIERDLASDKPIPLMPHSLFREYRRTGNRTNYERLLFGRSAQLDLAAQACYLGMDRFTYLEDLLWADCESTWWELPAHEGPGRTGKPRVIDLFVAIKATQLATIVRLFEDRIDAEVRERVIREVRRRAVEQFFNPHAEFWWKTGTSNWNAVCHGGVAVAAMLVESDPQRLARLIRETLQNLRAFLEGFTPDGGCTEGPGYWQFGFGWYVTMACALYDFTGGRINIMAEPRIEKICRYPLTVAVRPGQNLPFSDTGQAFIPPALAANINRFHRVPELYGLCCLTDSGTLRLQTLADLMLCDDSTYAPLDSHPDSLLPDLGVVRVRSGGVTVGAKAGHNGEHHNHNDVGSFVIHRGGTFFLTDPGGPIYSANTFNEHRYESVFCNSFGHSVPVVNGQLQQVGSQFAGTLEAAGLNGAGVKTIGIEMAGAYGEPSLARLSRRIELSPEGKEIVLTDSFAFREKPQSVEEAFITTLPAKVSSDSGEVIVQSAADGTLRLRADGAGGCFRVVELTEESRESREGQLLRRITFQPDRLEREMVLRFRMAIV